MGEIYLPVLSHFQNGNAWTASDRRLRYQIVPDGETLTAEAWEGPWSYDLSRIEDKSSFPLDEAGLKALEGWIAQWSTEINARAPKGLEETIRLRDVIAAERRKNQDG